MQIEQIQKNSTDEDIMRKEFKNTMKELKRKKEQDVTPAELLNQSEEEAKDTFYNIVSTIHKSKQIASDVTESCIITISKKVRTQACDQYKKLSLTSQASKVLTRNSNRD